MSLADGGMGDENGIAYLGRIADALEQANQKATNADREEFQQNLFKTLATVHGHYHTELCKILDDNANLSMFDRAKLWRGLQDFALKQHKHFVEEVDKNA